MKESQSSIDSQKIIRRKQDGELEYLRDELTIEEPLEIRIGGKTLATTMRTPGHDDELAAGFLLSEAIVRDRRQIVKISADVDNIVTVDLVPDMEVRLNSGQRFGPAAIDASQPGMRIGTAEDFSVSHSRQFDIHRVQRFARDLFLTIHPRSCFADDLKSLSLLHSSTSIAIMLADPLHGFLAARKLSTELCFFDLFKNLVEARARGQSHGDQIPTP